MKFIPGKQASGKTTELIRMAADMNGYLVVADHSRAYLAVQQAKEMGVSINFPLTYAEFVHRQFHRTNCAPLFIDDVDELLRYIANGCAIAAVAYRTE